MADIRDERITDAHAHKQCVTMNRSYNDNASGHKVYHTMNIAFLSLNTAQINVIHNTI